MIGCFGVAPAMGQAFSAATSARNGGNMDYRLFAAGNRGSRHRERAQYFLDSPKRGFASEFAMCTTPGMHEPDAPDFWHKNFVAALRLIGHAAARLPYGLPEPVLVGQAAMELYWAPFGRRRARSNC